MKRTEMHRSGVALWFTRSCCTVLPVLLASCAVQEQQTVYSGNPLPAPVEAPPPQDDGSAAAFERTMLLADILYAARVAFADNRLMTPAHDNAYDRYMQVLGMDPGNEVARQGVRDIALRYIELADTAMLQGKHADAATLLRRAESLDPDRPELAPARERLRIAQRDKVDHFPLDPDGLRNQSLDMLNRLAEIADHIRRSDAIFLINARSDEEGRWIYKVMRESVGGERLRGNIDISGTPNIIVTIPAGNDSCTTSC